MKQRKRKYLTHSPASVYDHCEPEKFKSLFSLNTGRWFGGFDSLENALMKNDLVQKEARTPK